MALTSAAIVTTNTLEEFRLEFNKLRVDVTALDTADTYVTNIVFEGTTTDDYQTTLAVTDPTADRTITLPNLTGTLSLLDATETLTNKTLTTPVIAEIDSGSSITLDATTSIPLDAAAGDINLTPASSYDINVPANIGITFGDDGEKIEGDGTDLTITGNNINLTATADVVVPANVGVTFGSGEKIEGNNTDLTVTSGADINLTAVGDVNIPSGVGVTFGNDGEKIEGDGTDLTVASSGALTLTSTSHTVDTSGDIILDADGGDVFFKDGGTTFGSATNTSGDLIVKSGTTTALTFSGANVTAAGTIGSGAITSTGVVTATGFTIGNAEIIEAELEQIDGITAGTAAASKAVVLDSNKDITGMRNVTIAGDLTVNGTTTSVNSNTINVQHSMVFEGATDDAYETTLTVTDPTADRTITFPNLTGTVSLLDATETLTNKTLTTPVIAEIDSGGDITLDATTDIVLDADGGDIFFKDGGTTFGSATNTSGNLIIKSGTTTALTFSGASATLAGDLTVSGDDLFMATNTSGAALIADGTNFNPVVISGDLTIGTNGVAALGTGVIVNADVNASAAIADSKLATISTADKVSGAAIQVDGATSGTSVTLAATDKFLIDDSGTTKYINASQINTFVATAEGLASVDDVTALAIALG